jgi:hypothetical protein
LWPEASAFEAEAPLRRLFEHAAIPLPPATLDS